MEWVEEYDFLAFMFSQSDSHHIFVMMYPPQKKGHKIGFQ